MNPFEPVATFLLGWMKQSLVGQWLRFLFELAFSAGVTFLFVCGSVMVATRSGILGIGFGMIAAAVSATAGAGRCCLSCRPMSQTHRSTKTR